MELKQDHLQKQQDERNKEMHKQLQAAVNKLPQKEEVNLEVKPVSLTAQSISTQTTESSFTKQPLTWDSPETTQMMQRIDTLMRNNEAKDKEIAHLRDKLKEKTDLAQEQHQSAAKTEN